MLHSFVSADHHDCRGQSVDAGVADRIPFGSLVKTTVDLIFHYNVSTHDMVSITITIGHSSRSGQSCSSSWVIISAYYWCYKDFPQYTIITLRLVIFLFREFIVSKSFHLFSLAHHPVSCALLLKHSAVEPV